MESTNNESDDEIHGLINRLSSMSISRNDDSGLQDILARFRNKIKHKKYARNKGHHGGSEGIWLETQLGLQWCKIRYGTPEARP